MVAVVVAKMLECQQVEWAEVEVQAKRPEQRKKAALVVVEAVEGLLEAE